MARVIYVDLLRLVASLQMLQGHSIDAVLAFHYRQGAIYSVWSFSRGLTSVAFLFVAGLAFELSTLRRFERHKANKRAVRKRFRRAVTLIALGYLLHLPVAALFASTPSATAKALGEFFIADVLQCIGVTLAFLELLVVLASNRAVVMITCFITAVVLMAVSPLCGNLESTGAWGVILNYFSVSSGSLFPLVPWSAHFLLGVVIGGITGSARDRNGEAALLFTTSILFVITAFVLQAVSGPAVLSSHLLRLGLVVLVSAFLAWTACKQERLPFWLEFLAGETLIIYVFHILLVYGYGFGLGSIVGKTLTPFASFITAIIVIGSTVAFAFAYRRLGRKQSLASASPTG
ncbi:MAG: DUF1624 domain-containing protein [Deltaproteobacteria bacterium]|nr:DUF1624 domain-containing protein [Deltaproteobacteria bacterium]